MIDNNSINFKVKDVYFSLGDVPEYTLEIPEWATKEEEEKFIEIMSEQFRVSATSDSLSKEDMTNVFEIVSNTFWEMLERKRIKNNRVDKF